MQYIAFYDYFLLLPYIGVFYFLTKKIIANSSINNLHKKLLVKAWWLKVIACVLYAWVIVYYYGYGDPIGYFFRADIYKQSFLASFSNLKYLFLNASDFQDYIIKNNLPLTEIDIEYYNNNTILVSKIAALASYVIPNRFLLISFFFTNLSFWGAYLITVVTTKIFPADHRVAILCTMFIPSCVFWSSGIAKEPICILAIGILFYYGYDFFITNKKSFWGLIWIIFAGYVLFVIKNYILACFIIGFINWLVWRKISSLKKNTFTIKFVTIILLALIFGGIIFAFKDVIIELIKNDVAEIIKGNINIYSAVGAQQGGSLIDVSSIDVSSTSGVLAFLPKAIINVFFRPFPWEISNVLMVFTVMENLFFTFLFIKVTIRTRLFTRNLNSPFSFYSFSIAFSVFMALIVGISTFNFGTMVRYKMPFLPFWALFLVLASRKQVKQ